MPLTPANWVFDDDHKLQAYFGDTTFGPPRGIFAEQPAATPKYARNVGERYEYREDMARLFIDPGSAEQRLRWLNSITDEKSRALADALGGMGYVDFLLHNATHSLQEKLSVTEMLSNSYVAYYFGQAAPSFTYSGSLINSRQDDQAMNMYRIYRDIIRGTKLAQQRKLVRLRYDGLIVSGTAAGFTWVNAAENEMLVPFTFQILVSSIMLLPNEDAGIVRLLEPATQSLHLPTGTAPTVNPVRLRAVPASMPVEPATEEAPVAGMTGDEFTENMAQLVSQERRDDAVRRGAGRAMIRNDMTEMSMVRGGGTPLQQ